MKLATDEAFRFLFVKLTAKNKNDIFMIRFDKKLKLKKYYHDIFLIIYKNT